MPGVGVQKIASSELPSFLFSEVLRSGVRCVTVGKAYKLKVKSRHIRADKYAGKYLTILYNFVKPFLAYY
jgi:hypothetical protein